MTRLKPIHPDASASRPARSVAAGACALFVFAACQRGGCSERVPEATLVAASEAPAVAVRPNDPQPAAAAVSATPRPPGGGIRFAIIGDFGSAHEYEGPVAELVKSEKPDFVITVGDNNYPSGGADTIDENIGRFYSEFIHPYVGRYGKGAAENRFFPALGNHDWYAPGARPHLDYFKLPGNERYYDFVRGDVHFFAVDSDENEPDGISPTSKQAAWLKGRLAESRAAWQIVYMHHPPFSSGRHGSTPEVQWPYGAWGADLVLAGHDHHYERLVIDGVTYLINGLGGRQQYPIGSAIPGSRFRYNSGHGAQFGDATASRLAVRFMSLSRTKIDEVVLERP